MLLVDDGNIAWEDSAVAFCSLCFLIELLGNICQNFSVQFLVSHLLSLTLSGEIRRHDLYNIDAHQNKLSSGDIFQKQTLIISIISNPRPNQKGAVKSKQVVLVQMGGDQFQLTTS